MGNMYKIIVTASNYNPELNDSITITAKVTDFNGNIIPNASFTIKENGNSIHTATTDNGGEISKSVTLSTGGVHHFTVNSSSCTVKVNPYPIGSIYIQYQANNKPSNLFGGTWTQIQGRFLLGEGTVTDDRNVSTTFTAKNTGGEINHTVTTSEMANHNHTSSRYTWNWGDSSASECTDKSMVSGYWGNNALSTRRQRTLTAKGGGQSHNNLPPYIAVYIWERTG